MDLQDFDNAINEIKLNPTDTCYISNAGNSIRFKCGKGGKYLNLDKMRKAYEDILTNGGSNWSTKVFYDLQNCERQFFLDFIEKYGLAKVTGRGKKAVIYIN